MEKASSVCCLCWSLLWELARLQGRVRAGSHRSFSGPSQKTLERGQIKGGGSLGYTLGYS